MNRGIRSLKYYTIATTEEYDEWYEGQSAKERVQIFSRLTKIQDEAVLWYHKRP